MNKLLTVLSLLVFVSSIQAADKPVPGDGLAGEWAGVLDVGAAKLRLALHIKSGPDETLKGSLDSLDQGGKPIGIDTIEFAKPAVTLKMAAIGGAYTGKMNEDGSVLDGTWSQGDQKFPLTFHRTEEAFTLKRPQLPKAPFPYEAKDVTFRNTGAKLNLAGTLITPKGNGPFPAVLFVTGSGPQDRDESLMGHKPFLVIADYLARRGVASLRYDDRGFAQSQGSHMGSTVGDFATDAEAGITFLAAHEKIDKKAIGIIGHSEGGLSGPRAATAKKEVTFLVLLAPPGEPLSDLLDRQARDLLTARGLEKDLIDRALEDRDEDRKVLLDESLKPAERHKQLLERSRKWSKKFNEEELKLLEYSEERITQQLGLVTTPWYRSLMGEDPADYLKQLKIPILALFGEKDVQVAPEVNANALEAALKTAGNPDVTVTVLPQLNHLFQHSETGAMEEYGELEETFAPEALKLIGDWIGTRFGSE